MLPLFDILVSNDHFATYRIATAGSALSRSPTIYIQSHIQGHSRENFVISSQRVDGFVVFNKLRTDFELSIQNLASADIPDRYTGATYTYYFLRSKYLRSINYCFVC